MPGMATLAQKIQCERDAREMLKNGGLPEPDRVEYGHGCIRLFWEETKVVLVVDIDDPPPGFDLMDESLEALDDEAAQDEDFDYEDAVQRLKGMDDHEEAA